MNSNPWLGWRAQTPSSHFAARTVASILRDQNERRTKGGAHRWLGVAAAAMVLIAGGAWAWTALPRTATSLVKRETVPVPAQTTPKPSPTAREPAQSVPEPPHKLPASPSVIAPRRKETASPPTVSSSDAGRKIIVPRCNCQEAICDCLEEH